MVATRHLDRPGPSDVPGCVWDDKLISQWTPLVRKVARELGFMVDTHDHEGMELDDAMQAGYIGLWLATKDFDPAQRTFVTHAYHRIRWEILEEMGRSGWVKKRIHVPVNYETFDEYQSLSDPEAECDAERWLERVQSIVDAMDFKRRNIYQGTMRHDDVGGKAKMGYQNYTGIGISTSRVSQLRQDVRKRLRELH